MNWFILVLVNNRVGLLLGIRELLVIIWCFLLWKKLRNVWWILVVFLFIIILKLSYILFFRLFLCWLWVFWLCVFEVYLLFWCGLNDFVYLRNICCRCCLLLSNLCLDGKSGNKISFFYWEVKFCMCLICKILLYLLDIVY